MVTGTLGIMATITAGTDLEEAWKTIAGHDQEAVAILESYVDFRLEISVIVARGLHGTIETYVPVENQHRNHILDQTIAPARIAPQVAERAEIIAARDRLEPGDKISTLAQLANAQFKLYEDHFAGKSRVTRRPGLLRRVIENLNEIQKSMQDLRARVRSEANDRNIGIVGDRLRLYRDELAAIEKARDETSLEDLAGTRPASIMQVSVCRDDGRNPGLPLDQRVCPLQRRVRGRILQRNMKYSAVAQFE